MTDDEPTRIDAGNEVREKLGPDAKQVDTDEGITYLTKEYDGFNAEALEAVLMNIEDMVTKALATFREEGQKDHVKLNIVGSVLYALSEMYRNNLPTLQYWHELVCTLPKLVQELNAELSGLLGRPIDIDGVPAEEVESLVNEVLQKEVGGDLDRLREYMERKNRES